MTCLQESLISNNREAGRALPLNWGAILSHVQETLPDLLAIYAFGSRIHGDAGVDSDLDLAVLVAGKTDPVFLWRLAGELADISACAVDLLDLRIASTVMQYQIITTGTRLWNRDLHAALYECFILSEKTFLDEALAPLMEIIQREGVVHGR